MLIRHARVDEAGALTELAMRSKQSWGYDDDFMERVRTDMLVRPDDIAHAYCVVAEDDGRRCGYLLMQMDAENAFLRDLFIEPDCFGRGIGKMLFEHALAYARRAHAKILTLQSDPYAQAFYERFGMRCVAQVPSSAGNGRTLPVMELVL